MDFDQFDTRHYPTLGVRDGYAEWAPTYERVVQDEMDLRLLERLTTVRWADGRRALDLACGTGRIGRWLRAQGVARLDGIDLTPADAGPGARQGALRRACCRATCARPACRPRPTISSPWCWPTSISAAWRRSTGKPRGSACPAGSLVIVGYHPHFLLMRHSDPLRSRRRPAGGDREPRPSVERSRQGGARRAAGRCSRWTRAWSTTPGSRRSPTGASTRAIRSASPWSGAGAGRAHTRLAFGSVRALQCSA